MKRLVPQVIGLGLIVFVLWRVGWNDRAVTADGTEHFGRIASFGDGTVTWRDGTVLLDVQYTSEGLAGSFATVARRPGYALAGAACLLAGFAVIFFRWGILLHRAGLATPWYSIFRLAWVGQFFGAVLPGGTGTGDLVKAVYVARWHPGRRTRAVITVFVDRALGLIALCLIAVGAILAAPLDLKGGGTLKTSLVVLLALGLFFLALLLSRRLRRALGLTRLVRRLPFQHVVEECGQAADIYGRRPGVVLGVIALSFVSHGCFLCAYWCFAGALGFELPLLALGAAVPVAQIVSAVPGLPGGWGVGEGAFYVLLPLAGVAAGKAVALSVLYRILHTLVCLPGWFWIGHGGERIEWQEARAGQPAGAEG